KKIIKSMVFIIVLLATTVLFSQTTSTQQATRISNISRQGSIGSRTGTFGQGGLGRGIRGQSGREEDYRSSQLANFLAAIIGSYLRHPDPKVRIQAIQSLTGAMVSGEGTRGTSDNRSGVRGLFGMDIGRDSRDRGGEGVGGAIFIPDLFVLLNDPDPEVQDMASMGLDILFETDVTILRFMDDPDPVVRQYATKIFSTRSFAGTDTRNRTGSQRDEYEAGSLQELIALRTLLVRLKYEKDEGVRKVLTDSIELYLQSVGLSREGQGGTRGTSITGIFGVDPSIIKYLNDDNPEIRKNAVKIISAMEYNPQILNILLERLKKETDDEVKQAIENAIDTYTRERARTIGTQGGVIR
ncbi:MAG: HEAT repeat domain-containing protein, partial [Candidatus Omnitrophica bacterium]|nr:HEAT repeat domain-containing protein [Candidatus Omnitrophota bacterium]